MVTGFLDKGSHKKKPVSHGFTLVELMVVVVIIGVLVAIAIPIYGTVTANAANRAHEANIRTLIGAANMALVEGNPEEEQTCSDDADWADPDNYIPDWPTVPAAANLKADEANVPVIGDADPTTPQGYTVVISTGGAITVNVVDLP